MPSLSSSPAMNASPEPLYRMHVFACINQRPETHWRGSCAARGSRQLCDYMCRLGMALGARRIRINHAGCLNVCEHGPVMVVYPEGVWYKFESEADVEEILRSHIIGGHRVERLALTIDPATLHG